MTNRELNIAIAEKVMGWHRGKICVGGWYDSDNHQQANVNFSKPSTDRNAAALVLERVEELRFVQEFEMAFEKVYIVDLITSKGPRWLGQFGKILAPPRLLMEAALAAVDQK